MQRMSPEQARAELERILAGVRHYQPQKVILSGSFARGDYHALSDVDLAIGSSSACWRRARWYMRRRPEAAA